MGQFTGWAPLFLHTGAQVLSGGCLGGTETGFAGLCTHCFRHAEQEQGLPSKASKSSLGDKSTDSYSLGVRGKACQGKLPRLGGILAEICRVRASRQGRCRQLLLLHSSST